MKSKTEPLKAARRAIIAIASREGKPVEEIRANIKQAIQCGMSNPDPTVQNLWKTIPYAGESPEPEELILWAMTQLTHSTQ